MDQLKIQAKQLQIKCINLSKDIRTLEKEMARFFLQVLTEAEKEKITKEEADHLFGYFLEFDFYNEFMKEIIFDGARLELPSEALQFRPEINIKKIKERCLKVLH